MARDIKRGNGGGNPWNGNGGGSRPEVGELDSAAVRFVEEYLKCLHGPRAAQAAGSEVPFADSNRWLSDPRVQELISLRWREVSRSQSVTPEHVLGAVANVAFANVADLLDDEGRFREIKDLPRHVSAAIKSFKRKRRYVENAAGLPVVEQVDEVSLWSATEAQVTLMKYLGMFEKDNRQRGLDAEGWKLLLGALFDALPAGLVHQVMDRLRGTLKGAGQVVDIKALEGPGEA